MQTINFQNLIQAITKRDFYINTSDAELNFNTEYQIKRVLPLTGREIYFIWKTPKTDDKMLKSFITAFSNKYKEPDPKAYDCKARTYGEMALWINKTEIEKEYAYWHHSSNMFNKKELMEQIEYNFNTEGITDAFMKYGFYPTEYGVGIFVFFFSDMVKGAVEAMHLYLKNNNIPYSNEYSDARWVLRFKLNLTKDQHSKILEGFTK